MVGWDGHGTGLNTTTLNGEDGKVMEDVTRGGGVVDPRKYKNDVLTQAWVDSRVLATLMVWLDSVGAEPRTLSEIIREPLKAMVKQLVSIGEVKMVDDTGIARQMLEKRTRVDLSRSGRGGKNRLHNSVLDARRGELASQMGIEDDDINRPMPDGVGRVVSTVWRDGKEIDMEKFMKMYDKERDE